MRRSEVANRGAFNVLHIVGIFSENDPRRCTSQQKKCPRPRGIRQTDPEFGKVSPLVNRTS